MNTDHYLHELPEMATHLVEFLKNWYKVFPEFANQDVRPRFQGPLTRQTYISGESYAGQYIPYIAQAILATTTLPTQLKGLLIGNGWIDPYNQYPAYLEFALKAGVVKTGSETEKKVRHEVDECRKTQDLIGKANVKVHTAACESILASITDSTVQPCVASPCERL